MSELPESKSSNRPDDAEGAFPFAAPPAAAHGPETVINPDKQKHLAQGAAGDSNASSMERALFPSASEIEHDGDQQAAGDMRLEHFRIVRQIGSGGMGAVFEAVDERLQRTVALKVLAPHVACDAQTVQRFQNEAQAAAQLHHDSIAGVYYVGQDQGLYFIAYEFVAGTNLRVLIQDQGQLPPVEVVNCALQIAIALKQMESAGVTHRDIKPSNIIIDANRRAKLVDLGLARKQSEAAEGELTLAGTTMGTFDYISPEQAKDPRQVDVRSDIYSLGCTLYHMLTGEPPYPEGTMLQKLLDHQGKTPPDPAVKNRRVPRNLSAVVTRMMASDPQDRFQTPDQLIRELMTVARTLGMRSLTTETLIWAPAKGGRRQFWERHLGWMSTAAALVLIVFLLQRFPQLSQKASQPLMPSGQTAIDDSPSEPPMATSDIENSDDSGDAQIASLTEFPRRPTPPPATIAASKDPEAANPAMVSKMFETILPLIEPRRFPTNQSLRIPVGNAVQRPPTETDSTGGSSSAAVASSSDDAQLTTSPNAPRLDQGAAPPVYLYTADASDVRTFNTLEAACSAAVDGDVIELAYNGRRSNENTEKPLQITEKKVVIRARSGFRPIIAFGSEQPGTDTDTRMITLTGGSIELINVDLQMLVNDTAQTDLWSLFSLHDAKQVLMRGVTLQVVNPNQRPAAVIEIAAGFDDPTKVKMPSEASDQRALSVALSESVVVAESDLFRVQRVKPGRLNLSNAAIMVQGVMLRLVDGTSMPAANAELELHLDHTTCHIEQSLVRVRCDQMPAAILPLQVVATNNVFSSMDQSTPLIFMDGEAGSEDYLRLISAWYGSRNCYDGFSTFWLARNDEGDSNVIELDFADWQQRWLQLSDSEDSLASNTPIPWSIAWRDQSIREVSLLSFILDTSRQTTNPAVFPNEELNAGAELGRLPAIPLAKPSVP